MHRLEPRSRVNEWAKFIVTQSNFIFSTMGLVVIAGAIYAFFADFGNLDKGFFLSYGLLFFLFGVIMTCMAWLGGQGVFYQRKESKFTSWSGTRILCVYQAFLVVAVIFEVLWVVVSMDAFVLLRDNAKIVLANDPAVPVPPMSSLEYKFAEKFNAFFFGAVSICDNVAYQWFWNFVNKRCTLFNANMSQLQCQRCESYSVTACAADSKACYETSYGLEGVACPYQACRSGVLEYIVAMFKPFIYFGLFLFIFQMILVFSNCALICYHRRDSDAEIKAKNGIFVAKTQQTAGGAEQAYNDRSMGLARMEQRAPPPPPPYPNRPPQQNQAQFRAQAPPPAYPQDFAPPAAGRAGPHGQQHPSAPHDSHTGGPLGPHGPPGRSPPGRSPPGRGPPGPPQRGGPGPHGAPRGPPQRVAHPPRPPPPHHNL